MQDKRKLKGQKTRKRILDAANRMIEKEGVQAVSTRQIALLAGISQSSLYHHFKSADEIIISSMVERAKSNMSGLKVEQFTSLEEYLNALFAMVYQQVVKRGSGSYFSILEKARTNDEFREEVMALGRGMKAQLVQHLELVAKRPLSPAKLEAVVFAFSMIREGLISHLQIYRDQSSFSDLKALAGVVFRLLAQYLET